MAIAPAMRRDPVPRWRNAVWRWHFYAGLFCMPFVLWLSLTGSLYLWRPQLEGWLDGRFDRLVGAGEAATPDAQVAAALAAVPGSTLHRYIVPGKPRDAVRILVTRDGEDRRVTLDPHSLAVLDVEREEGRPFRLLFHLHGELLAGTLGSVLVETAACWTIVMLITGLVLWWPREGRRLAGVLYPRLRAGRRVLWRDLHATAGVWVSILALGLILTGLPWAKVWGGYFQNVRAATGALTPVDWTIGGKTPSRDAMVGDHGSHGMDHRVPAAIPGELGRVLAVVAPLALAPPVLVSPPRRSGGPWSVASNAADRPLRSDLKIDGASGRVVERVDFAQRHWLDRVVGTGVAAHEGALFGLANQLGGTAAALLLSLLSVSGAVMWWRRRPAGGLGAPPARERPVAGGALAAAVLALGVAMPMFGATLVLVLVAETLVLRRMPRARRWLGLPDLAPA